jgi:hypothetical protein
VEYEWRYIKPSFVNEMLNRQKHKLNALRIAGDGLVVLIIDKK